MLPGAGLEGAGLLRCVCADIHQGRVSHPSMLRAKTQGARSPVDYFNCVGMCGRVGGQAGGWVGGLANIV